MPDKKLIALVGMIAVLNTLHTIDHVVRGDLHWPIDEQSVIFVTIVVAIYAIMAFGLYLYRKSRIGPRFWMIVGTGGLAFGWLSHFSPFTDQSLGYIVGTYRSVVAGWLAVGCLIALMLAILFTTLYAAFLWRIGDRIQSKDREGS